MRISVLITVLISSGWPHKEGRGIAISLVLRPCAYSRGKHVGFRIPTLNTHYCSGTGHENISTEPLSSTCRFHVRKIIRRHFHKWPFDMQLFWFSLKHFPGQNCCMNSTEFFKLWISFVCLLWKNEVRKVCLFFLITTIFLLKSSCLLWALVFTGITSAII